VVTMKNRVFWDLKRATRRNIPVDAILHYFLLFSVGMFYINANKIERIQQSTSSDTETSCVLSYQSYH
jgi:hypothetical protein